MKATICYIITFAINFTALAQSDTVTTFFNEKGFPTKKVLNATSISKQFKVGNNYVLERYDKLSGFLIKREMFEDEKLTIKSGRHELHRNGKLILRATYKDNYRNGSYMRYDTSGNLTLVTNYQMDSLNGVFSSFWDNGVRKEYGNYLNGKKIGEWTLKYPNDSLALREIFNKDGQLIDSVYLTENGSSTSKINIITPLSFEKGTKNFYEFIGSSIRYPIQAAQSRIQGTVKVF